MKKKMKTEEVGNLKYLLAEELTRMCKEGGLDIGIFMGVDGRIFSSYVPKDITAQAAHFLQLIRSNLDFVCAQLRNENLQLSVQRYPEGTMVINGVGKNAFIAALSAEHMDMKDITPTIQIIDRAGIVIKHIFELRPLAEEAIEEYSEDIQDELRELGSILFKERYTYTKEYQKNMEILEYIKNKITEVVGKGDVESIVTLTMNEMGVQPASMNRQLWMIFVERVIKEHVAQRQGDIIAEECLRTWLPEIENKLKTFV